MKIRVGRRLRKIRIVISTSLRLCGLIRCLVRKVLTLMSQDRFRQASSFLLSQRPPLARSLLGGRTHDLAAVNRCRRKLEVEPRRKLVSQGCVAVYVGEERRRFVIPILYLSHPFITTLLAEPESYEHVGPLTFPCDVDDFEQVKWLIDREKTRRFSKILCHLL